MKVTGIIAEYNPFHKGHKYQLDYIRNRQQADYIIVAMSGDYVQRGTPALLPKHIRTQMALSCGADLVIEIPVQISSASAEYFASGAVSMLNGLGVVNELCFGSECGDISTLMQIAEILNREPVEFKKTLARLVHEGYSYPAARADALKQILPGAEEIISKPNNILGTEYCRALLRSESRIRPVTLKRHGASYHSCELSEDLHPSAEGIRNMIRKTKDKSDFLINLHPLIPENAFSVFADALSHQSFLLENDLDDILSYVICFQDKESLMTYPEISSDLADRIYKNRFCCRGFIQFTELLKTKDLTRTRIQRTLLHILLNIKATPTVLPYARILGFRKNALPLFPEIKTRGKIPLVTKTADADNLLDIHELELFGGNTLASNFYEMLLSKKTNRDFVHEYQKQIIIL